MKTLRILSVSIAVAAIFLSFLNPVYAGPSLWPANKGEMCFNNISNGQFVRLAVFHTVGNNYIVQGYVTEEGNVSLFNGNAVLDGDKVLMNVTSSGYKGDLSGIVNEVYGSIGRVELLTSNLNGSVLSVSFHCVPGVSCEFNPGDVVIQTLTPTPCP